VRWIASDALLLRSVELGETDLVVTLFTETCGKLAAIVRGGRRGAHRFGGALEPFHTMHVGIDDRGRELGTLREARIELVRASLVGTLEGVEAAGRCLRWARHLFPLRTPEPNGWRTVIALLDAIDAGAPPGLELAAAALNLLTNAGYGLDFERCVRCGKPCPHGRAAAIDAARGGLICQACGGGRRVLTPNIRRLAFSLQRGERPVAHADANGVDVLVALAEEAMVAHADLLNG
jgi:DNA repair protein RecO (recombination protein O)